MIIKYNKDGLDYMVMVPDGTAQEFWQYGAVLGPPDLGSLGLVAADLKKLHNRLVEYGVYDGQTLDRRVLRNILKEMNLMDREYDVLRIFTTEYF